MTTARPSTARKRLGDAGERLAAAHLAAKGYRIVERQWRRREGEIDIIAWDGACLVFVEVRARRGGASGTPEESITPAKQRTLWQVADLYLATLADMHPDPPECRFDLVAIQLDSASGSLLRCEHIIGIL